MQLKIPEAMRRQHAEFIRELLKAAREKSGVGQAAWRVDEVFFEVEPKWVPNEHV